MIINISNFLEEQGFETRIVENSLSNSIKRVADNFIESRARGKITKEDFLKFGFTSYFRVFFPILDNERRNRVSLIMVRRIPGHEYLTKIVKNRQKVVFCLHGVALEKFRVTNPLIMIHQLVMRIELKRLASFLSEESSLYAQVLNSTIKSYLEEKNANSDHIFLITNGIDTDFFQPGRNDEQFQVIFEGRIEDLSKGVRTLKKVINMSNRKKLGVRFVIIGSGKDEKILLSLPKNANFYSFVDEDKKEDLLSTSNLMLVTSNLEPFSLAAIEGLIHGLPVISTPVSGPASILSHNERFGRVSSFKPSDIASEIGNYYIKWFSSKSDYYEMKRDISKNAKELFDESKTNKDYMKMIDFLWKSG